LLLDEPTAALDVEARRDFWASMRTVVARGKTVIFATHYLEEADAFADRIVLLARGSVVADAPPGEIKSRVGGRMIRATLPGADLESLRALPGVIGVERRGDAMMLTCSEAETALRGLLDRFPSAADVEVRGAALEDAFLALTTDEPPQAAN
jgi:ABC-2 type transport system ATP-binding protein